MEITEEQIKEKLENVLDPELNLSIMDLGLVYGVKTSEPHSVQIKMTLTTLGCPLYSVIEKDIKDQLNDLGFKDENIDIELTFDPPWTMERMSERGKAMLGI